MTKQVVDNVAGKAFMDLSFPEEVDMLDSMTKQSSAWHTRESEGDDLEKKEENKKEPLVTNHSRPPSSFPYRLKKKTEDTKFRKFMEMLKKLMINLSLVEALEQMPGYAKFITDLITKKRAIRFKAKDNLHHCGAITIRSLVQKKTDSGAFTIPCTIGPLDLAKALCDIRASINLMPLIVYKKLGLGNPTFRNMRLVMADRSVKWPVGILYEVLVKFANFIFSAGFVILDCEVELRCP
ncbi:uncharacterized protein LOC107868694 [Capsicum annuum]|uniref:uncharacterized protein LOC107868694 n=1 Tax=Capsicum annuum TaxID=4072 RepID=UPI001FB0862D|nr:uncharacterized protein LOC107868694 [Capsicum annuum]